MNPKKKVALSIGENLQVYLDNNQYYPSLLEDITDSGHLLISFPTYRGIPVPVKEAQRIKLFFFRENGRYSINAQVEGLVKEGHLRLLSLLPLSEPHKQQRRDSFRLAVNLDTFIRLTTDETEYNPALPLEENMSHWEEAATQNLSETGVSLYSKTIYRTGDCLQIHLPLPSQAGEKPIYLLGMVRQTDLVEIARRQYYRLGIEFLPYEERIRHRIARFILQKQLVALKITNANIDLN